MGVGVFFRSTLEAMGVLITFLVAGAVLQAAPAPSFTGRDACALLGAEDIRAVQDATLADRKGSEEHSRRLHFAQCVFTTTDLARSVSLMVITRSTAGSGTAARDYWNETFHARGKEEIKADAQTPAVSAARKKNPPRAIAGAGTEAFWTGDARAGALYVLRGDVILRISVGGLNDEEERIRRSKTLAGAALQRLPKER